MNEFSFLPPTKLLEVFEKVKDTLPDAFRTWGMFNQLYWAKTSAFLELGQGEGVLWLANILGGWKASIHLAIWGERLRHQPALGRATAVELLRLFQLQRLEAFIPVNNAAACKYAEKAGFVYEGTLSKWDQYDGKSVDVSVYGFLKENSNG